MKKNSPHFRISLESFGLSGAMEAADCRMKIHEHCKAASQLMNKEFPTRRCATWRMPQVIGSVENAGIRLPAGCRFAVIERTSTITEHE